MTTTDHTVHSTSRRTLLGGLTATTALCASGVLTRTPAAQATPQAPRNDCWSSPYTRWANGPDPKGTPSYFPIGVWLQDPKNAQKFMDVGVNLYISLWDGPTKEQLDLLAAAHMPVMCAWKPEFVHRPEIVGWLYGDEPDNATYNAKTGAYDPRTPAGDVMKAAAAIRRADPTRPVYLNLSRGVADQAWVGHGEGFEYEEYWDYAKAPDIISRDVYPKADGLPLWYPAKGVDQLRAFSTPALVPWSILETGPISNPEAFPSVDDIWFEAWTSIIHGARGLVLFGHYFPEFDDHWWYNHPTHRAGVARLTAAVQQLASIVNQPSTTCATQVISSDAAVRVDHMTKRFRDRTYVLAASMTPGATDATFTIDGASRVTVLFEDRSITARDGHFTDHFDDHTVHLYEIARS